MSDMPSVLERNLESLRGLLPSSVLAALAIPLEREPFEVIATPTGQPTARVDGRLLYSRRDPAAEAARLVAQEVDAAVSVCLFYHFGLGYHPEAFLASHPLATAVVIEPDVGLFAAALRCRDLSQMLASERLRVLIGIEPEELPALLDAFPGARVGVVRLRALDTRDPAYFSRTDEIIHGYLARREVNRNTLARFGRLWTRNLLANVGVIARTAGIMELRNRFAGFPALVLAAGPSLDRVTPLLRELAQRAVVIAVDTSLRAVLRAGVTPDFCVVVDPQYWNTRHLDGCFPAISSVILVSESSTHPAVFRGHRGPVRLCSSLFPLGEYLERDLPPKGKLGAGGSVATTAWDFARMLGCDPIYLAGLDLGFPERRTHFKGAYFEERVHALSQRTRPAETHAYHALVDALPFPVENASGGTTLTDQRLVVYRWWFENQLQRNRGQTTYSLSPLGVRIRGLELAALEELLLRGTVRPGIELTLRSLESSAAITAQGSQKLLNAALKQLLAELRAIECSSWRAVSLNARLEEALHTGEDTAQILAALDEIDAAILHSDSRDIAGFLVHSLADEILGRGPNGPESVMKDSGRLYAELAHSSAYHSGLVERAIARMRSQSC